MLPPPYQFSVDDQMNPVYCTKCRTHIPRAVSNAGGGVCPTCIQAQQQAHAHAQAQQAQAQQAHAQQLYSFQTGRGVCPGCKSQNIGEVRESGTGPGCLVLILAALFAIPAICFWPLGLLSLALIIVGAIMMTQNKASRVCNYCGHRWTI